MVRLTLKDNQSFNSIPFRFPNIEAATKFIDIVVDSAENPVSFQIEKMKTEEKIVGGIVGEIGGPYKPDANVELYKLRGSRFINPEEGEKK